MKSYDIISFHPGRQHNFEQANQLRKHFTSFKHITSLFFGSPVVEKWKKVLPAIGKMLGRRSFAIPSHSVDTNPVPELKLLLRRKLVYKTTYSEFLKRNEAFQKWLIRSYAPPKVCIGFDTASWEVFREWKGSSFLVLDLSIALPQHKLTLANEYGMDQSLINNLTKQDDCTYSVYEKEAQLADLILCGSDFVKQSCLSAGISEEKLFVLPYGINLERFHNKVPQTETQTIKIAFVGYVHYRKGADILLKAWAKVMKEFAHVELHFFGRVEMDLPRNLQRVFFHGFVEPSHLAHELRSAHIFVLPTFFEGSSLAVHQAMAMGLAVITTRNAGSIVEHLRNGLLVRYGLESELVENIKILIDNPNLRKSLAIQGQIDAQSCTWDRYGDSLSRLLNSQLTLGLPILEGKPEFTESIEKTGKSYE
jgi:glycosyltransferase involved in cell wall biosynthesis